MAKPAKDKSNLEKKEHRPSSNNTGNKSATISQVSKRREKFPIVGMGASAGGLDALKEFFLNIPDNTGMAFVIVSHLDPEHVSIMPELIQRCTKMPVSQVEHGMMVQENHVYLIPPNKEMAIKKRTLLLSPQTEKCPIRFVINNFFHSLAQDQKANANAIIFSGAGSDGSAGIGEIRKYEGMVMAQNPETAAFDSMPSQAIATGMVDYILPPSQMPAQLVKYMSSVSTRGHLGLLDENSDIQDALNSICFILRNQLGHDFSSYKQSTICRRIERRMTIHQLNDISYYLRYLRETPEEVSILFNELLIGVTSFFRDAEAFDTLKEKVLLDMVKTKSSDTTIRIWVPGCSTGEEAYSIAMMLQECIDSQSSYRSVQIFATDIDEKAIEYARAGIFPASTSTTLSNERLKRFFISESGSYKIKNNIRGMLTFATQNIIMDPPFTKMDLISCRNLLIYLKPQLQKKLMSIFHYSLLPQGTLFLGSSESIGDTAGQFSTLDQKQKIFMNSKDSFESRSVMDFPLGVKAGAVPQTQGESKIDSKINPSLFRQVERRLLEKYAPSCVIINEKSEIVYIIHSGMGKYLDLAYGNAQLNIIQMAKQEIRNKLTAMIRKASGSKVKVSCADLEINDEGNSHRFNLIVEPLFDQDAPMDLLLVIFESAFSPPRDTSPKLPPPKKSQSRIQQLETELATTKEDLQLTVEAMQSSNEELQSINEELQSTNEELQSSNEELETSKEELQSLNEELATVNSENDSRIYELSHAVDDIRNLLDNTPYATLFLDCHLHVKRFTPKTTEIINLIEADIDRPISHIVSKLKYDYLVEDANSVLKTLIPVHKEVQSSNENWYILRMAPYRTISNVIDGVVVTFDDITERKRLESSQRLATVIRNSSDAITLIDLSGNIKAWNRGAEQLYGWREEEAILMNLLDMVPVTHKKKTSALLKKLNEDELVNPQKAVRLTKDGRKINIWFIASKLVDESGKSMELFAATERMISEK